jgi:MarR family transcriptional regulator, negative regulator of the multidrug operon emrRAB
MNNPGSPSRFEMLEASLQRLSARMPDTPVTEILLSRMLMEVGRGMAGLLEQQIRPFGLAEAEFRVLTILFSQPEGVAHPGDLCARTAQRPANMSRISDALVSRDLITRVLSAKDRRRMVLRITEQGEDLVRRLLPVLFAPLKEMFTEVSEAEQLALIAQLKRLAVKADEAAAEESRERLP